MHKHGKPTLALFYCQNIPQSDETDRQTLETKYGGSIRFFPIPCSGRLEPIHLLKALEEFADAAYVITCPDGACKYFEGNRRARKRVEHTRVIIKSIGLEGERVGVIVGSHDETETLAHQAERLADRVSALPPSPVHARK